MSIAGNSRGATVKAANSKIAVMLRKREEDDALLTIGKRKTRDVAKDEIKIRPVKKGKTAWEQPADFSFPTPLVDRPRTADGAQSFHFSYTTISKTGVPTDKGKPIGGLPSSSIQPALDHSKYIEREGAAELSAGAEHAGYIERPGAVELSDPTSEAAEAVECDIALLAGEGLSDEEATHVGPLDEIRQGIPSVFSNISDDAFEREEYWRAVYRSERTRDIRSIQLDLESSPAWWANLDADSDLDPSFKAHVLQVKEAHQRYVRNHESEASPKPFVAEPYPASSDRAGIILKQAARLPGYRPSDAPTVFKSGRGGRAQIRFVAELPHEISPEDRALIVQNYTDHLGSFSTNKDGVRVGLMYTAVIHAPDIHNDARNYHLHIVAHDRPARYLHEYGQWDFEVAVDYVDPGSRKIRTNTPFRQNKIGEVSQGHAKTKRPNSGRDFIPAMRAEFARITNLVLEARGIEKRYDPRSYTDMGIERDPTEHLGTKAAALEAAGVPTTIGKINAIKIWRDAEQAIEKNAAAADAIYKKKQKELADLAAAVTAAEPRNQGLIQLRRLAAERQELIDGLAEDRRLVQTFDHLEAKAKSRAVRTRQTCLAYLTDITAGNARPGTARLRPQIQERFRVAQAHIAKVDALLAGDRANIVTMSRSIVEREAAVVALDRQLEPLLVNLRVAAQTKPARPLPPVQTPRVAPPLVDAVQLPVPPVVVPERTDQPATRQPAAIVTATPPEKEISHGRATTQALLASVGRYQLALRERDLEDAPDGAPAGTLSSLRHLSGIGMVHHQKSFAVFLQRDVGADLGRGRSPCDELRREGAGDRETQQGSGGAAAAVRPADPQIVELSPAAIEGAPIVAPSLPPRAKSEAGATPGQPDGLDTLRAPPAKDDSPVTPETIIADLSATDAQNRASAAASDAKTNAPLPTAGSPAAPTSTPGAAPAEPRIDGRKRVEEPKLFDLPEQLPPVKPGTTKHEYQDWDKLLMRIAEQRIPIAETSNDKGGKTYSVPALDTEERALLNAIRFSHRTNNRLGSIYDKQKLEIDSMVRWIDTKGKDPTILIIENRSAKLGKVPPSIQTLMRHWKTAAQVVTAVRNENGRRIVEAEARRENELPMPNVPGLETITDEQRRMRAELVYPDPRYVDTKEVAEFTTALRKPTTPIDQLEHLADRVRRNHAARDDIMCHSRELAEAYTYHVKGAAQRDAERARMQTSNKSNGLGR